MENSLRGQFLIAGKPLRDPNFYRTVVLIVEHNAEGAMGLVVNRPSSVLLSHALAEHFDLPGCEEVVGLGGPVEPSSLFILHSQSLLADYDAAVLPDVFVGGDASSFEKVIRAAINGELSLQFRVYSGCAGWGPGQLEDELSRGDWHVTPADADAIFHEDPYSLWEQQFRKVGEANRIACSESLHPEWN